MEYTRLEQSDDYRSAREKLRIAEGDLIQQQEAVSEMRRALPAGPVVDDYVFLEGPRDLAAGDEPVAEVRMRDLFTAPDRALVVYQLMYGKAQTEGCPMCSMWIDGWSPLTEHFAQSFDFVVAAAADVATLRAYARGRGWDRLRLLSCGDSTFKYDMGSEDAEGNQMSTVSVFARDGADVHMTYTATPNWSEESYERGIDLLTPVWAMLDLTPRGRGDWYPSRTY